jgi:hypothetical protein
VCASAFENYLTAEVMRAVESPPSQRPHVMPLVVSVKLPGGELAAEVDCYVNVKPEGSSLIHAHVAIPPNPSQAEQLCNHNLCMEESPKRGIGIASTPDKFLITRRSSDSQDEGAE